MSDEEARLRRVDPASAPEEVRPTFDAYIAERGQVANLFRVAAHAPEITTRLAALQFLQSLRARAGDSRHEVIGASR